MYISEVLPSFVLIFIDFFFMDWRRVANIDLILINGIFNILILCENIIENVSQFKVNMLFRVRSS